MSLDGPTGACADQVGALIELANSVFRADGRSNMEDEFRWLYHRPDPENLRIFADAGRPVALIATFSRDVVLAGTRHRACLVGSVCTHPDYRGRGLATRLLADVRRRAVQDGCDLMLISGGRGLYERAGYVRGGDVRRYTVRPDQAPAPLPGARLEIVEPADVGPAVELHSLEPTRFVRPPQDFRMFLEAGYLACAPFDLWLVREAGGAPLATVACRRPGPDRPRADVREVAGSRVAAAGAFSGIMAHYGAEGLTWETGAHDAEAAALAAHGGWPVEPARFPGTLAVVEVAAFWRACAPLRRERAGGPAFDETALSENADGTIVLRCGRQQVTLRDRAAFTRLAFAAAGEGGGLPPDVARGSPLGALLDALFPLPLVQYGMNYV
jgi:GNAT superfamily N-acetyltransferase